MAEPAAPKSLTTQQRAEYEQLVRDKAAQMGVDPDRAARFVRLESNFDPAAKNPLGGAAGLFQFVPETAKSMGLDERTVFDANANADAGIRFMANVNKDLSKRMGREISDYEHYIGHFLGPRGAQNALVAVEKTPNMPMPKLLHSYLSKKRAEKQLRDNPEMRKETVGQFIARQQAKVGKASEDLPSVLLARATPAAAPVAATAAVPAPTPARMNPNLQAQGQKAAATRAGATPKAATPQELLSSASQYGPDYQAALALAALGDEDDDEEYTTKSGEPLVRARSMLDEMAAAPAPTPVVASLDLKAANPFAALQPKGGGPVRLAMGGIVEPITPAGFEVQSPFANSANQTVASMAGNVPRGTMPGTNPVFRAEGSPESGEGVSKEEKARELLSKMKGNTEQAYLQRVTEFIRKNKPNPVEREVLFLSSPKLPKELQAIVEESNASLPAHRVTIDAPPVRFLNDRFTDAGMTYNKKAGQMKGQSYVFAPETIPFANVVGHESYHSRAALHGTPAKLDPITEDKYENAIAKTMKEFQPSDKAGKYWGTRPSSSKEEQLASLAGYEAMQPKGTSLVDTEVGKALKKRSPQALDYYFTQTSAPYGGVWEGQSPERGMMSKAREQLRNLYIRGGFNTVNRADGSPEQGETSLKDRVVGAGESAASMMSGMLGSIPAGYQGLATLLRTGDAARAAQAVREGQERYTYQPRTEAGKREAQSAADLLEKLNIPAERVGEYALEKTGSPAAATMAQIVLDPLNLAPGPRQLASAAKGVPKMVKEAAMQAYGPAATASHVTRPAQGGQVPKAYIQQSLQQYKSRESSPAAEALNNWIDTTLTKYVTRDLGTANDPILRKAEEGKLHFTPSEPEPFNQYMARTHQEETGMGSVAQSPLAQTWEANVDTNMVPTTAKHMLLLINDRIKNKQHLQRLSGETSFYADDINQLNKEKAWLEKVPEDQLVHYLLHENPRTELGLNALVDGVKNLIDSGEIRPVQLSKLSIGDAVERIYQQKKTSMPFYEAYNIASKMSESGGPLERGVPLPKEVSQFGTAEFLPLESGYQWRRIIDPRATEVQAKMMANSISGYNGNVHSYSQFERPAQALRNGAVELYALYDPEGRVVTHVEYVRNRKSGDRTTNDEITQVFGNGPRTGNEFPENYMEQVKQLIDKLGPKKVPNTIQHYFEYGDDFLRGGDLDNLQWL